MVAFSHREIEPIIVTRVAGKMNYLYHKKPWNITMTRVPNPDLYFWSAYRKKRRDCVQKFKPWRREGCRDHRLRAVYRLLEFSLPISFLRFCTSRRSRLQSIVFSLLRSGRLFRVIFVSFFLLRLGSLKESWFHVKLWSWFHLMEIVIIRNHDFMSCFAPTALRVDFLLCLGLIRAVIITKS